MLRHFLYLNSTAVDSYLGVVEGGLSDERTRKSGMRGSRGGEGGVGILGSSAKIKGDRESSEEEEFVVRDTVEHRFERLIRALEADPERWAYEPVLDLGDAFDRLVTGTFISVDCEVEIPPISSMLAQPEQLNELLDTMETLAPIASAFGQTLEGMPGPDQVKAVRSFTAMKADLIVVGDVDEDAPRVAGKLDKKFVRDMPHGEVTVVGKVAKKWKEGEHYSLFALPGAALMNRSQRRAASNTTSVDPDDANFLHGPAITLDILAIYR